MIELNKFLKKFVDDKPFLKDFKIEHQFALLCASYYYYDNEITNTVVKTIFVDGPNDGGLDIILNDPKNDNLILAQSKMTENLDKELVLNIFEKMGRAIDDYRSGNKARFTDSVRRALAEGLDSLPDDGTITLVLFTTFNPDKKYKEEINDAVKGLDINNRYYLEINYIDNINDQIEYIDNPKDFVECGKIVVDKSAGKLIYKNGLMVNVSSKSIANLYETKKDNGLFDQNLRYYIKNDKVDNGIEDTLKNEINNFWYFNNGIIIGCSEFIEDGNEVKLYNFSIINGCQTTSIIGKYDIKYHNEEFWIPCKIISLGEKNETNRTFIGRVAEASNTQKPINPRDLKSNRPEQRQLKKELDELDQKVFMEIKRGEIRPKKNKYQEKWQRTTNEEVAQLIMAVLYQKPGTSRSQKKSLFNNKEIYNNIFLKGIEAKTIVDLLRLSSYYDKYIEELIKNKEFDNNEIVVAKNGKMFVLAIVGMAIKDKRMNLNLSQYKSLDDHSKRIELSKNILSGTLISNYSDADFDEILKQLLKTLIQNITNSFKQEYEAGNVTSASNYFKTDNNYYDVIVPIIIDRIINNYLYKEEYKKYLKIFD